MTNTAQLRDSDIYGGSLTVAMEILRSVGPVYLHERVWTCLPSAEPDSNFYMNKLILLI